MQLRISIDGISYEVDVEAIDDDAGHDVGHGAGLGPVAGYVPPRPVSPPVPEPMPGVNDFPSAVCRSPVTGIVVRIPVERGQRVEAGDLMMVLEAMKMETEVAAPRRGIVKSVTASHGQGVRINQVLVEFE